MKGNGILVHNDPTDRAAGLFSGTTTLIADADQAPYLLQQAIELAAVSGRG